ncbi:hypothetical protein MBM_09174 [Drepanopeziza brunnea f. sp. 'multigermtubi' MB_m1]|uniref:Uncharacterized protein n=1 Tax=Marssonina brunnea f. sp. multigermtubi (strain MB_m1) TaxID=1072389 RepID=K1W6K0_MARBU|nr:uncharacterized protein MBM_09174 [Drepanopeziza brunnea f. sp. 'multigermtubi' MB_m1]EKD12605.1 hypothetical protein MBM_09174 [Drepanopeziza brunnea f. sp. 'multigermtubi' MB_m1]
MDRSNFVTASELVQIAFEFLNDLAEKAKASIDLGAGADRSNRSNKFFSFGNALRLAIKTLGSSRKDPNTPKLLRHHSVNEIEYGAGLEYGPYSDDSDDGPYSDALEDHQELLLADPDALDNKGNVEA